MPNQIDENGLQISSLSEVINALVAAFNNIYGANINLDQNTPDAQLINIFAQMIVNNLELLLDINASFDPDQAVGVILDQRVKLNGITRKQGSYTRVYVNVTFNNSGVIKGLDQYPVGECFQVSDSTGNILVCEQTTTGVNGSIREVSFRALNYGALIFNAGSITKITTPTKGIASVTNLNSQYFTGNDEESDSELRVRRTANALQRASVGETNELYASLINIEGVNYANVLENTSNEVDEFLGIPAHGIWIIVDHIEDSETIKNIGTAIYNKRIEGTPMKYEIESSSSSGDLETQGYYIITRPNGTEFIAYWTKPTPKYIDITVEAKMLDGSDINSTQITDLIRNNLTLQVGQVVTTNTIENIILNNIKGIVVTDVTIAEAGETPTEDYIEPAPDKRIVAGDITVTQG
ncbi:MAG: baseplate J/gp47 family protein [Elusimicrobia bacterium]|nr:baseplate J/gp47 family protein [Elusimicrobiota bacterium]